MGYFLAACLLWAQELVCPREAGVEQWWLVLKSFKSKYFENYHCRNHSITIFRTTGGLGEDRSKNRSPKQIPNIDWRERQQGGPPDIFTVFTRGKDLSSFRRLPPPPGVILRF